MGHESRYFLWPVQVSDVTVLSYPMHVPYKEIKHFTVCTRDKVEQLWYVYWGFIGGKGVLEKHDGGLCQNSM